MWKSVGSGSPAAAASSPAVTMCAPYCFADRSSRVPVAQSYAPLSPTTSPSASRNRTWSHMRRPSLMPVGSLCPPWLMTRTRRSGPSCASSMSLASRSICTLRAMAVSTRLCVRPIPLASAPSCARTARTTHEFAPANPCCGTSGRSHSVSMCSTHPAPSWSGMWQSWHVRITPVGWLPPNRRSANATPSAANALFSHSLYVRCSGNMS